MLARCGQSNRRSIVLFLNSSKKPASEVVRNLEISHLVDENTCCWIDLEMLGLTARSDSTAIQLLEEINVKRASYNNSQERKHAGKRSRAR